MILTLYLVHLEYYFDLIITITITITIIIIIIVVIIIVVVILRRLRIDLWDSNAKLWMNEWELCLCREIIMTEEEERIFWVRRIKAEYRFLFMFKEKWYKFVSCCNSYYSVLNPKIIKIIDSGNRVCYRTVRKKKNRKKKLWETERLMRWYISFLFPINWLLYN